MTKLSLSLTPKFEQAETIMLERLAMASGEDPDLAPLLLAQQRAVIVGDSRAAVWLRSRRPVLDIVLIDPDPTAAADDVAMVIPARLEDVDPIAWTGSDAIWMHTASPTVSGASILRLFMEILPEAKAGSMVGLSDICLPWPPPAADRTIQMANQILHATLVNSSSYLQIVLANTWMRRNGHLQEHQRASALWAEKAIQAAS